METERRVFFSFNIVHGFSDKIPPLQMPRIKKKQKNQQIFLHNFSFVLYRTRKPTDIEVCRSEICQPEIDLVMIKAQYGFRIINNNILYYVYFCNPMSFGFKRFVIYFCKLVFFFFFGRTWSGQDFIHGKNQLVSIVEISLDKSV